MSEDCVIKRDGAREPFSFDKILRRVRGLVKPGLSVNCGALVQKIIARLHDNIRTDQIDELMSQQCASLITTHPDYGILASRILISNHHKRTPSTLKAVVEMLHGFKDVHGCSHPLIDDALYDLVVAEHNAIEAIIDYDRDFDLDYFGFKTLERAYLMRIGDTIVERPQHMWMRVALAIHGYDLDAAKETYDYMSGLFFTHATPTLFNAGTPKAQLSSCFLLAMEDDSIDGIYRTLADCAKISKWAGGIGLHIHNIRAQNSHIRGTNGTSNGITPMLRVFNDTARYVDQGGGKRNGSFAIYLEPWHADIEQFLEMKKNHGDENARARDLFYALWIPDLFMRRVKQGGTWTLMCPDRCRGLADVYGAEFDRLYEGYEAGGCGTKTINARQLWFRILDSQIETGTPYMLYKDACNRKSNQKNLGTIKSSNLCTEIVEYSDSDQTAVCNLASVALSKFASSDGTFNYSGLHKVVKVIVSNLNKVIDANFYPTPKAERSNLLHRPIGIGVQGLADAFAIMDVPFCSDEAKKINTEIFETIYHASLERSNEIASRRNAHMAELKRTHGESWGFRGTDPATRATSGSSGDPRHPGDRALTPDEFEAHRVSCDRVHKCLEACRPIRAEIQNLPPHIAGSYSSFVGSPAHSGILQFDLWGVEPSERYNWSLLRTKIRCTGLRNSLLVAPMPTASTSQILGNNECIEPFTSNIYVRRTIAGEYVVINRHLFKELIALGQWNEGVKNSIIASSGSIQHLKQLPEALRDKYKTVWEMPMKQLLEMARDRGAFVCQSQSLNLWMARPSYNKLTAMHFFGWEAGLKTGMYYLRTRAAAAPQQFTLPPKEKEADEPAECIACGS
jgi:ribonucleotide reductase alpha subunit